MRYHADIRNDGPRLPIASSVKGPGVRMQKPRDTAGSRYCYASLTEGHFKGNNPPQRQRGHELCCFECVAARAVQTDKHTHTHTLSLCINP